MTTSFQGSTAGRFGDLPYVAFPPANPSGESPIIVVWHMMDPPRTAAAMAAALPLADLDAWRVYLELPLFGVRMPQGGPEEVIGLLAQDAVLKLYGAVQDQAVAEFRTALGDIRTAVKSDGPLVLVGGSAGGAIALAATAEPDVDSVATVAINPVTRMTDLIALLEGEFAMTYNWGDEAKHVAARYDFATRASELTTPLLLVMGENDSPELARGAHDVAAAAPNATLVTVPDLAHALAEEPGVAPAPQTAGAAIVEQEVVAWLRRQGIAGL